MRHHPAHDLSRTYRCVSILLGRAALRADQHVHLLFPPVMRVPATGRVWTLLHMMGVPPRLWWHMPPGNPDDTLDRLSWDRSAEAFAPPNALIDCLGLCEIGCAGISGRGPRGKRNAP